MEKNILSLREVRILYPFNGYAHHVKGEALFLVRPSRDGRRPVAFQMLEASLSGLPVTKPSEEFGHLYGWLLREYGDDIFAAWMLHVKKLSTENHDDPLARGKKRH